MFSTKLLWHLIQKHDHFVQKYQGLVYLFLLSAMLLKISNMFTLQDPYFQNPLLK